MLICCISGYYISKSCLHFLILAENAVESVSYFEVQEMLWMKCNDAQIYHHHHYHRRRNNKKNWNMPEICSLFPLSCQLKVYFSFRIENIQHKTWLIWFLQAVHFQVPCQEDSIAHSIQNFILFLFNIFLYQIYCHLLFSVDAIQDRLSSYFLMCGQIGHLIPWWEQTIPFKWNNMNH